VTLLSSSLRRVGKEVLLEALGHGTFEVSDVELYSLHLGVLKSVDLDLVI
jgi:hypothetical protein